MAINKKTLLEQAKLLSVRKTNLNRFTEEEMELALAWVSGEITLTQVGRVSGMPSSMFAYTFLACALRQWMNEESQIMATTNRYHFLVTITRKPGDKLTKDELMEYVQEAVQSWKGCYDPESPEFKLENDQLSVRNFIPPSKLGKK